MENKLRISIDVVDKFFPSDDHYSFETSYVDTNLEDILQKLYGMFVSMTYFPATVGRAFLEKGLELCDEQTIAEMMAEYGYVKPEENKEENFS